MKIYKNLDKEVARITKEFSEAFYATALENYILDDDLLEFLEIAVIKDKNLVPCMLTFSTGDTTLVEKLLAGHNREKKKEKVNMLAYHTAVILEIFKADFIEAKYDLLTILAHLESLEHTGDQQKRYASLQENIEDAHNLLSETVGKYAKSHNVDEEIHTLETYYVWTRKLATLKGTLRN